MTPSPDTRRVIAERRHGWERAPIADLTAIFDLSPQHVGAICRQRCASCGAVVCGCTDAEWVGS